MKASDVIAKVRARLSDDDKKWWSDDELLDNLNMALSAIATDLMLWTRRWDSIASFGVDTYSIPEDFMAPISLIVDDSMIEIKPITAALRSDSDEPAAFIDMNSLILFPMPNGGERIVLNYHASSRCDTIDSIMKIASEHVDSVIFYMMGLSLQKSPAEDSLGKSKYYTQLYKDRIRSIVQIATARRGGSTRSRHQKV